MVVRKSAPPGNPRVNCPASCFILPIDGISGMSVAQHLEIFQQHRALVFKRRLENLTPRERIFDLAKYPRIRHRTATNQNSIAIRLSPLLESALHSRRRRRFPKQARSQSSLICLTKSQLASPL